jgi:hypothetical protein
MELEFAGDPAVTPRARELDVDARQITARNLDRLRCAHELEPEQFGGHRLAMLDRLEAITQARHAMWVYWTIFFVLGVASIAAAKWLDDREQT